MGKEVSQVQVPKGLQGCSVPSVSAKLSYLWKVLWTAGEPISHKTKSS